MKVHVCSVLVIAALLFAEVQVVNAQHTSDGEGFPLSSPLNIVSPSNCTYSSNSLKLDVVVKFLLGTKYMNLSYSLDGKDKVTLSLSATKEPVEVTRTYANGTVEIVTSSPFVPYTVTGEAALAGLSEGTHSITVYAKYIANNVIGLDDSTVWFTVDTGSDQSTGFTSSNSTLESAGNWSEVARFSGNGSIITTEPFSVDYAEWRIRWEIEPKSGFLSAYVYPDEPQSGWIDSIIKVPEDEETNGTLYIHDRNGTFYLEIMATQDTSYVLIVEQNLESVPSSLLANSEDFVYFSSGAKVFSPINRTYNSRFLTLNLTFGAGLGIECFLNYTIDDKYEGDIPLVLKNPTEMHIVNPATGFVVLPELSEGSHCLTINVLCGLYDYHGVNPPGAPFEPTAPGSADYEATWSDSLYFTVDTGSEDEIPEFPVWTILPAILSVTVVVVMLRKMLKTQKGENNVE